MLVAEYMQNGYLIQVYRENGKRSVIMWPARPTVDPTPLPLYLKKWGVKNENKKRDDADSETDPEEKE